MSTQRLLSLLFLLALAAPASWGQVPPDSVLRDFVPIGDLQLVVDGMVESDAEILRSDSAAAFLVLAPPFPSPLLLSPRQRSVESVDLMKVSRHEDGSIDLLADALLEPLGFFDLDGTEVVFQVAGKEARLREKPPLLGTRKAEELTGHNPEYRRLRDQYEPQASAIAAIDGTPTAGVEVRVFFGSWCPACKRYVPKLLRVQEALGEGGIHFEYYGLPHEIASDPEAKRFDIHGVPTGIVFRGGKEIGRISGGGWKAPEETLRDILGAGKG